MKARSWSPCLAIFLGASFIQPAPAAWQPSSATPPSPQREYRAAWIATVSNIDWPSKGARTTAEQKAELIAIMNKAVALKLNTLIFQVRPGCDALYSSEIEPWSEYLTGTMGKAPSPYYDPLSFAIQQAHSRGIELHAWFNPYRARHSSAKSPISANHISKTKPQLVREYGRFLWLDPGEKEVQDYSLSVVMDVVKRYDIDGVHFDDYFYPYKERAPGGGELEFPDNASWKKYGAQSKLSRDDWRRQNVNEFIERVYKSVKGAKPWVKFGISPFGIWRPGYPPQIKGFDQYDKLYADARKWLQNGWCDYFAPQLYWSIEAPEQSYPVLLKWWAEQNEKNRFVVPGMNSTSVPRAWKPEEITRQITLTRKQEGTGGHIHWNMGSLMRSKALSDALIESVYAEPAIPPRASWLSSKTPPAANNVRVLGAKTLEVKWQAQVTDQPALWVVQTSTGGKWKTKVLPGRSRASKIDPSTSLVAVTALDRFGAMSKPAAIERK